MEPVRFTSTHDNVEDAIVEERWEARPVVGLFRVQMRTNGEVKYEGEFFIGNFKDAEAAIAFVSENRTIVDRSDQ